jgi:hypothetical protein
VALAAVLAVGVAADCWAWGATGHEWVSGIAIEKLPDIIPEFVRTPEAAAEIAVMGRELDRSKGSGKTHDAERDPGHYVDLSDDAAAMGIVPPVWVGVFIAKVLAQRPRRTSTLTPCF